MWLLCRQHLLRNYVLAPQTCRTAWRGWRCGVLLGLRWGPHMNSPPVTSFRSTVPVVTFCNSSCKLLLTKRILSDKTVLNSSVALGDITAQFTEITPDLERSASPRSQVGGDFSSLCLNSQICVGHQNSIHSINVAYIFDLLTTKRPLTSSQDEPIPVLTDSI
jgi:hypothetical protein